MVSNSTTTKKETPYQAIINDIIIQKNEKVRSKLNSHIIRWKWIFDK